MTAQMMPKSAPKNVMLPTMGTQIGSTMISLLLADRVRDRLGRQSHVEIAQLVVLHGLTILRELQRADDEAGALQLLQMHVQEGPAELETPRQLAHVLAPARERRDDAEPVRVAERVGDGEELVGVELQQ